MIPYRRSLLIGMTLTVSPALALGSAPVYGLKDPSRVPRQYFVSFKTSQELAATLPEQLAALICPNLRPSNPQQAQKLATCLADHVGATNFGVLHIGKREVAVIKGLSDSGVSTLANDPRVNSIQVVHWVKKAAVQTPG
jgi:hypothetical protein